MPFWTSSMMPQAGSIVTWTSVILSSDTSFSSQNKLFLYPYIQDEIYIIIYMCIYGYLHYSCTFVILPLVGLNSKSLSCQLACVLLADPVAAPKHHGSEGRIGPAAAAHGSKRCFLNSLETSSKLGLCPPFIGHLPACLSSLGGPCRSTKTPWQRRTDRARGGQPMVPNVTFWTP